MNSIQTKLAQPKTQKGATMIGVMIAVVIVLVLMVVFMKGGNMFGVSKNTGPARKDHLGTTLPGAVHADAEDTVCRSNLQQIRMSIELFDDSNGNFPPSLDSLKLPASMLKCPLGGQYIYDPTTGKVHCNHPGHEKF